jgi:capsular exopolysaccharide synthesis family protein
MSKTTRLIVSQSMKAPVIEAYKTLRTNIQFSNIDDNIKVIMVTSTVQGEGKSATSANLAISIAQSGKKVLLIDCDLRRSSLHRIFHILNSKGLTNVLVEDADYKEFCNTVSVPNLKVLTGGPKPPNPSEQLGSEKMKTFLEEIHDEYDYIILDAPPVLPVSDALVLAHVTHGVVFVLQHGEVEYDAAKTAINSLKNVGAKILGVVLNKVPIESLGSQGYYYYYDNESEQASKLGAKLRKVFK